MVRCDDFIMLYYIVSSIIQPRHCRQLQEGKLPKVKKLMNLVLKIVVTRITVKLSLNQIILPGHFGW